MTQTEQILRHLRTIGPLTSIQSFRLFAITRLPDRVRDLRTKGHTIYAERIRLPSGKWCARYSL